MKFFVYHNYSGQVFAVSQTPITDSKHLCTVIDAQLNPLEVITRFAVINGELIKKEEFNSKPKTYINSSFFNIRLQECKTPNIVITLERTRLIFERKTDLSPNSFKIYVLEKGNPLAFKETKCIDADIDNVVFLFEDTAMLDFYAIEYYGEIQCCIKL
jgi:hypothetical protein